MKKWIKEENFAKLFCVLAMIPFALLFCFSIKETWVNDYDLVEEYVFPVQDSLVRNVCWVCFVLFCGIIFQQIGKCWKRNVNMDIIAAVISVLACAFSFYWVNATLQVPQADQLIACDYAIAFENGDWEGLEKGMYVGIYQHQLGLITLLRLLYKVFGNQNYLVFQYINAFMIPLFVFSGYQVTKKVSEDDKVIKAFYLILTIACVPLYCYVPFVYGEIISTSLIMFAAWMLLGTFEKFSVWKLIMASIAIGVAVQLRTNALIFMIGFLIVSLIHLLRNIQLQKVIHILGVFVGVVLIQSYINHLYDSLIPADSFSAPASVYIAMGVNDDNGIPGWHNYYDQIAFAENEYDIEKTNKAAWEYLRSFFEINKDNPAYLVDFYYRKLSSQWNSPMYQCLAMNNNFSGEPSGIVEEVYWGDLREWIEGEMNIHQLFVYGGVCCLLLFVRKRWLQIDNYLLLIGVFGGFLFSIMWEAKTRYVFPYYLAMLPYAAVGIYELLRWLNEKYKKIFGKDTIL